MQDKLSPLSNCTVCGNLIKLLHFHEPPLDQLVLLGSPLSVDGLQFSQDIAASTVKMLCDRIRSLDAHTAICFPVPSYIGT